MSKWVVVRGPLAGGGLHDIVAKEGVYDNWSAAYTRGLQEMRAIPVRVYVVEVTEAGETIPWSLSGYNLEQRPCWREYSARIPTHALKPLMAHA